MKFDSQKETENVIEFVKEYYKENNLKGAIVGISGGKDSAVVTAILVKALGAENVIGVTMPCHSKDTDKEDAKLIADYYGIELINYDLTFTYDSFKAELSNLKLNLLDENLKNSDINIKPRFRMATLYYLSALYSSIKGGTYLVAGTSNKSELFVGYFTKGGDQVHDFEVISDFTVSEVIKIGEYLKVPERVLYKAPSDGLSGQTDEDKMGVTYDNIEKYIYGKPLEDSIKIKIEKMHNANRHKFVVPAYKRKKIGVFVGSFDPIHIGHKHIVNYLLENEFLDKIILVPTGNYWEKSIDTSLLDRVEMCKLIKNENIEVSDTLNHFEYTYELMKELEKIYSADSLYLIIGADNIANFHKWKNIDKLLEYKIIVLNRNDIDIDKYINEFEKKENFIVLRNFDYIDISSSFIRDNINNDAIKLYLDAKVYDYIKKHGLYASHLPKS
jgi:NAD+ synthase